MKMEWNFVLLDAIREVNKALKALGYSSFRHGQENAVARIVSGSILVTIEFNL